MAAARVPETLQPQTFGLWNIQRREVPAIAREFARVERYTMLNRFTEATQLTAFGECVMEDTLPELRKHLPIWLNARGRVLVTGLGLGCVVRGLLANPDVDLIDVVEIDPSILRVCGAEFADNARVRLHLGDALAYQWPADARWDYAWHDPWTDGTPSLPVLHMDLIVRLIPRVGKQGAWGWPKEIRATLPRTILGSRRKTKRAA